MTYADFKDLPRRTASDKLLRDKAFNIGKPKIWWISKWTWFNGFYSSAMRTRLETLAQRIKFTGSGVKNKNM